MKILLPSLALFLLPLTSCQSISTKATSVINPAASTPCEVKKGMSKEEVRCALGNASYQYVLSNRETWVYEKGNIAIDKAKETAMNMVPVVGPAASLLKGLKPTTEEAKAAVCFDCKGKVTHFHQCKECPGK